ncbi:class I tRNA ligase family protein [Mycoplasma sp. 1199]|uniref:class I tRNA ligase family protein n=1 Tax=Mycoplasma sp. 1199 TaxID=3108526 RepID=UPI002B1E3FF7|nr:class I tRNA ligase family protein [Mycoplasma sp. 1199]MEA4206299.1 class I tRNA ligase family protein [Mycoplasma sp. 1199]
MLKIYVCGPTVYNDVHIGNMRPIVTMDLILKAAKQLGIEYKFVHNITDIDDKIIKKAQEQGVSETQVSEKYGNLYLDLLKQFSVETITDIEYVTKNIDLIDNFIQRLIKSNNAYLDNEGNVWFDVIKNQNDYGIVSNQKIENMKFEDSELSSNKKSPADFALWKNTAEGVKYNVSFGEGRPGWHTECVALIEKHFGDSGLDIHGGGMDLTFPHHENENIQFYALNQKQLSNKWLRTGQINLNGIKMSKSLQNVILASDFLKNYSADYFKMILLLNSFTGLINIDENLINNVEVIFKKISKIYFLNALLNKQNDSQINNELAKEAFTYIFEQRFSEFNKLINDLIKNINKDKNTLDIGTLVYIFDKLGFEFHKFDYEKYVPIYQKWQEFLAQKDYQNADKLRNELIENNLI